MARISKISWTDATWNPWICCHKKSPGCAHCYAERWASRTGRDFDVVTRTKPATFQGPLHWNKPGDRPLRIFSCSLSDFFIEEADPWREEAWDIIRNTRHLYMLLTKRPERISQCLPQDWPLDNVELGVSVETPEFLKRIHYLRALEAKRIFVSAEPLLAALSLRPYLGDPYAGRPLDGVIVGGESGPGFRVMEDAWARALKNECRETNTAFFFKQHSAARPGMEPYLDGNIYEAMPGEGFKEVFLDE